jgi:hypothetical protein
VAESSSEVWRNRILGLFLVGFGSWNLISGELLPFPTRQHVEGLPARIIGGIILAIGLLLLIRTIPSSRQQ